MDQSDIDLLKEYRESGSEKAFAEIVRRHLNLVYSVALRQVGGDVALARDVSQEVFILLAGNAGKLGERVILSGWLYRCARSVALDAMRTERRRRAREWKAEEMHAIGDEDREMDWERARPLLDEAISELRQRDRDAICLRFYEDRSFAEIATQLNLRENAARMRVSRALAKLNGYLASKGIRSTAAALGLAIGGQSGISAPAGLSVAILKTVPLGAQAAAGVSVFLAVINMMNTSKIVAGLAVLVSAVSVGSALYGYRQAESKLSGFRSALVAEPDLDSEEAALRARLASLDAELANHYGRLDLAVSKIGPHGFTDLEMESAMVAWATQVKNLLQFVSENADYRISEFDQLKSEDWMEVVGDKKLETIASYREALSRLRNHARSKNNQVLRNAWVKYHEISGGVPPDLALELYEYTDGLIDPAILGRYKVGMLSAIKPNRGVKDEVILYDDDSGDPAWSSTHYIGLKVGAGFAKPQSPGLVMEALWEFRVANNRHPSDCSELAPYMKAEMDTVLLEDIYSALTTPYLSESK